MLIGYENRRMAADADTQGHEGDMRTALRYVVDAYPNEPLFIIRGRDRLAVPAITGYLALIEGHRGDIVTDMKGQVNDHQVRFVEWAFHNPDKLKYPDAYPGWSGK